MEHVAFAQTSVASADDCGIEDQNAAVSKVGFAWGMEEGDPTIA